MNCEYRREVWGQLKGDEEPTALLEESGTMSVKVKVFIGDGNATVTKSHNRKIGLAYGKASAGASCTISLTCGQAIRYLHLAGEAASELAIAMLDRDMDLAAEWLEQVSEKLPPER